jgi:hypothetical protein
MDTGIMYLRLQDLLQYHLLDLQKFWWLLEAVLVVRDMLLVVAPAVLFGTMTLLLQVDHIQLQLVLVEHLQKDLAQIQ